jgi:hypothetical protein
MIGYRWLDTMLFYIRIEEVLFRESSDELHVKVGGKTEEIKVLFEGGCEYIWEKMG